MKKENESEMVGGLSGPFGAVCPGYNAEAKFSLTFSYESLNEKPKTENELVGKHLNWYLSAERVRKNDGEDVIVLFAVADDRCKYPMTYDVEYTIEAVNPTNRILRKAQYSYEDSDYHLRGSRMITCKGFLNERDKFEVDGKLTVTAKINVRMPMCYNFNGMKSISDVTIKIGKQLFPFNKACFAVHSNFFHAMFFGQFAEAKQDEVTLTDVDNAAFVTLFNVLFIPSFELQLKSVPSVFKLADRFEMLSVVNLCEKLLVNCDLDSKPTLAERLALATKYSLDGLQKRCLELCASAKIIFDVMASPFYKDLSDHVKVMLLDRLAEVFPAHLLR